MLVHLFLCICIGQENIARELYLRRTCLKLVLCAIDLRDCTFSVGTHPSWAGMHHSPSVQWGQVLLYQTISKMLVVKSEGSTIR